MTITLADEYGFWAMAQIRRAFEICKLKRKATLVKLMTVSSHDTAVLFTKVLTTAKVMVVTKDKNKYYKLRDWGVVYRKEGKEYSIYLDNSKARIRRIQRERRRR